MPSRLTTATAVVVAGVAAVSFTMSFQALTEIGASARLLFPAGLPLAVDGACVAASLATVVLRKHRRRAVRWYAPAVVFLGAAFSTYANALHALGAELSPVEAAVISAIPPLVLCASAHLLLLLVAAPTDAPRRAAPAPSTAAAARPKPVKVRPARAAVIGWIRDQHEATGSYPTGPAVAERLGGVSRKTGARLVAQVREGRA